VPHEADSRRHLEFSVSFAGKTAQPSHEVRVLAVDDSPISRKLLEHALRDTPCSSVFAKTGSEALQLFAENPCDLVITDWELPDLSGIELCRRLRSDFTNAYTYLVLLTGNSGKKSLAEGLAA